MLEIADRATGENPRLKCLGRTWLRPPVALSDGSCHSLPAVKDKKKDAASEDNGNKNKLSACELRLQKGQVPGAQHGPGLSPAVAPRKARLLPCRALNTKRGERKSCRDEGHTHGARCGPPRQ